MTLLRAGRGMLQGEALSMCSRAEDCGCGTVVFLFVVPLNQMVGCMRRALQMRELSRLASSQPEVQGDAIWQMCAVQCAETLQQSLHTSFAV